MKNSKYFVLVSLATVSIAAALGAGCSSAQVRVLPGEDGVNTAVARDRERGNAEIAAADAAKDYCSDKKKEAVFVKEDAKYTGSMDEETRKNVRNASTAAMVLGGFGSPVSQAGQAGAIMTNDRDYSATVVFKCK